MRIQIIAGMLIWLCGFVCADEALIIGRNIWMTANGDSALRGRTEVSISSKLERAWRADVPGAVMNTPVAGEKMIFVTAGGQTIAALDLNGQIVWQQTIQREMSAGGAARSVSFSAPLLYAQGHLIAASERGKIYAIRAATGDTVWTTDIRGEVQGQPQFAAAAGDQPDRVFILSQQQGVIYALNLADGKLLWKSEETTRTDGHPACDGTDIVTGNCAAGFNGFSAMNGLESFFIHVGDGCEMAGGVAIDGRQGFGGNREGSVAAADFDKQEILWLNEDSSGEMFTTPAVSADKVVFCGGDGIIYCLNRADGTKIWEYETPGLQPQSPVIAGDKVIAVTDGSIYLLNLSDGNELWKANVSDWLTSPAVFEGLVIVGSGEGHVVAFKPGE